MANYGNVYNKRGEILLYTPIYPKGRGRYGNNYWEVYSPKLNRTVKLFSDLEYDHWLLIESNPNIKFFCEQPKKIIWPLNGNSIKSIFDMWVMYTNEQEVFLEVKYQKELDPKSPKSERAITQTTVQRAWCQNNGYNYELKTEKEIRSNQILLTNIKQMLPYLRLRNHDIETDKYKIIRLVKEGPITLNNILLELENLPNNRVHEAVFRLLYDGTLKSNIAEKYFGPLTEVWINDQKKDN